MEHAVTPSPRRNGEPAGPLGRVVLVCAFIAIAIGGNAMVSVYYFSQPIRNQGRSSTTRSPE